MANEKDLDPKPGEQPPGKFHYNPGNMAGKTVNDTTGPEGERTNSDAAEAPEAERSDARKSDRGQHPPGKG